MKKVQKKVSKPNKTFNIKLPITKKDDVFNYVKVIENVANIVNLHTLFDTQLKL